MKILVCGGRHYNDYDLLKEVLDGFNSMVKITHLVHGDADGADRLGARWAQENGVVEIPYPAAWDDFSNPGAMIEHNAKGQPYNALAGIWRNQDMLDKNPDLAFVVAFPSKTSKNSGTKDMMKRAKKAGILVHKI